MKRFSAILAMILVIALLFSGCAKSGKTSTKDAVSPGPNPDYTFTEGETLTGKHYVEMVVEDYGTILLEVDADAAPISATNFLRLVNAGFYDGTVFHRIIAGFMAQGGAPNTEEKAAMLSGIYGEFAANGYNNPIKHTRGVLSMARAQAVNSASSQFFIMHADYPSLDGQYAAFGCVISGMDVVDAMCEDADPNANNGMLAASDCPVIVYAAILGTEKPDVE